MHVSWEEHHHPLWHNSICGRDDQSLFRTAPPASSEGKQTDTRPQAPSFCRLGPLHSPPQPIYSAEAQEGSLGLLNEGCVLRDVF